MDAEVMDRSGPRLSEPVEELLSYETDERRLVGRLLAYWHSMCDGRAFPSLKDIDADAVGKDWRWAFIIEAGDYRAFPNFRYLGPELAKYSGVFLEGRDSFTSTLLDVATHKLDCVYREGCPLLMEDVVTRFDGQRLMFRAVLLPLSDDGETIDFVLGAANGKLED